MKKVLTIAGLGPLFAISGLLYAQTVEPDPIVIIPGTMASWNWNVMLDPTPETLLTGWDFFPGVTQYDQLLQALEDEGMVQGEDYFIAFYDWRQPNTDSATEYLLPTINEARMHSASGNVDIIAHSMGGLVARSYIQSDGYRNDIDQFIMLGTPNRGSSDVYTLWEAGVVPENWSLPQVMVLRSYLLHTTIFSGLTDDAYDTIHTYVPSVQELLPTYDYLVDITEQNEIPYDQMQERNLFLSNLNADGVIDELYTKVPGGVSIIAGEERQTVGDIPVVPHTPEDGKLWIDGKPEPVTPERNTTEGDNRVLLSSAFLESTSPPVLQRAHPKRERPRGLFDTLIAFFTPPAYAQVFGAFEQLSMNAAHGALPTASIPELFAILDLGEPAEAYANAPEAERVMGFMFASPVEVQITSPSGETITKDTNEIPNAFYDGSDDPLGHKLVIIKNPEGGAYEVELTGLAEGEYHMGVLSLQEGDDFTKTTEGTTQEGQTTTYMVSYTPNEEEQAEIGEPVIEEPESDKDAAELLDELIKQTKTYYQEGVIERRGPFHPLLSSLYAARFFLERDNTELTKRMLRIFERRIERLERRGRVEDDAARNLHQRLETIHEALEREQPERTHRPWWKRWF